MNTTEYDVADLVLSSLGASRHVGQAFGRFDLVPGCEKGGSPVYRQAHSKEIPTEKIFQLYR